ncbi:hypothetical protein J2772_003056 [Chryseobacterium jejuense]|nr:hypothetical protein [Chryseobacterium jejuense]
MVQGVNTYYLTETERYLIQGSGFAWPKKIKLVTAKDKNNYHLIINI